MTKTVDTSYTGTKNVKDCAAFLEERGFRSSAAIILALVKERDALKMCAEEEAEIANEFKAERDALRDDAETLAQLTRIAMIAEQLLDASQGHAVTALLRVKAAKIAKIATETRKALVARHREIGR